MAERESVDHVYIGSHTKKKKTKAPQPTPPHPHTHTESPFTLNHKKCMETIYLNGNILWFKHISIYLNYPTNQRRDNALKPTLVIHRQSTNSHILQSLTT